MSGMLSAKDDVVLLVLVLPLVTLLRCAGVAGGSGCCEVLGLLCLEELEANAE